MYLTRIIELTRWEENEGKNLDVAGLRESLVKARFPILDFRLFQ